MPTAYAHAQYIHMCIYACCVHCTKNYYICTYKYNHSVLITQSLTSHPYYWPALHRLASSQGPKHAVCTRQVQVHSIRARRFSCKSYWQTPETFLWEGFEALLSSPRVLHSSSLHTHDTPPPVSAHGTFPSHATHTRAPCGHSLPESVSTSDYI